jgi:hypothetical protein
LRRRLWLVDLALLVLVVLAATALRQRWADGRGREEALLKRIVPVPGPPVIAPLPKQAPSTAAQYLEVAEKMVFSRDRNPTVILDPPAPPPPPKPMPQLPTAYGVMDLGDGPTAILREKPGAEHRGYRAGEKIGEFKVVAFNNVEIVLEWEGKYVRKNLQELADHQPTVQQQAPAEPQQSAAAPAQPQMTNVSAPKGPGTDMGNSTRACVPGDNTPAGTVQDGLRKVINKTPFGESCRWEPVQ